MSKGNNSMCIRVTTLCTKDTIGRRILRSLNVPRPLVKCSMDLGETTLITKPKPTVEPVPRGDMAVGIKSGKR